MLLVLYKKRSFRYLSLKKKRIDGRNYIAKTVYNRGGGSRFVFRLIDYYRYVWNIYGYVLRREYNPFKRSMISIVIYANGILSYQLSPKGLLPGMRYINSTFLLNKYVYWSTFLFNMKAGTLIYNIELLPNFKAQYCRSLGTFAKVLGISLDFKVLVKLFKTKKVLKLSPFSVVSKGLLIKTKFHRMSWCKAGFVRFLGWRPSVRGYAKNPVDHPHGGRTKRGLKVSRWGKNTKGVKTLKKKSYYEV